jgi:Zn-dependent protease
MFASFTIAVVRGVPIRVHLTALFLLPMMGRNAAALFPHLFSPAGTLLMACLLLGSVALHELGHTVVAQRYRIPVLDIVLTPIGGVARLGASPDNPRHEIRIALAGPYVSLILAAVGWLVFRALDYSFLGRIGLVLFWINSMLFGFNLLPSFPMDGGRVLRGWLAQRKGLAEATRIATKLGKFIAIGFMVWGFTQDQTSLLIIGIFILISAGAEQRMMAIRTLQEQMSGQTAVSEGGLEVGPPPYARDGQSREPDGLPGDAWIAARDLVSELCRHCRR